MLFLYDALAGFALLCIGATARYTKMSSGQQHLHLNPKTNSKTA
jgi:hypothetical protein